MYSSLQIKVLLQQLESYVYSAAGHVTHQPMAAFESASKLSEFDATVITACTVVQAVVKATSQSNGKGQILTPWCSETLERISMKLGI